MGMNYYETIDEKKDLRPLSKAKKYFIKLQKDYPNSDYTLDAKYKLLLIEDIFASKEMYIANII